MVELYVAVGGVVVGVVLCALIFPKLLGRGATQISVSGRLEKVRDMGDLVALSAYVKEVVTQETDPGFFFSFEKMILICEFDVEYRYDLRKAQVPKPSRGGQAVIELPQMTTAVHLKDFKTYDRTSGRLLGVVPWQSSAKEEDDLRKAAIAKAKEDASALANDLRDKIEASASQTLRTLFSNLADGELDVRFSKSVIAEAKIELAAQAA